MPNTCAKCGQEMAEGEAFCGRCGEQVAGATPAQPKMGKIAQKYSKQVHKGKIRTGRGAILAVAILALIGTVAVFALAKSMNVPDNVVALLTLINLGISGIFFGLWVWAKTNPLGASITALVVYLTIHIASAVLDPATIAQGILIKIIIIVLLIGAVQSALAYKKIQEQERAQ